MELTIVGCSGSVSGPDSTASCYLVRAPYEGRTYALVLDLGPGSFGQLYRYLDPAQVDAIGLSHLHPDHCLDLTGCYVAGTYSPTAPWPQIALLGPAGTLARVAAAYEVPGSAEQPDLAARFDERCWARTQELGPFRVDTIAARHPVEAYSLRITGPAGESLVYTGDTGPNPALAEFSAAADLLLAEAAFSDAADNPSDLHLSGRDAAQLATTAGVGRLVLTHIPPWIESARTLDDARPHFAGPILLAEPGLRLTI